LGIDQYVLHVEDVFMKEVKHRKPGPRMARLVVQTAVAEDDALLTRYVDRLKHVVRDVLSEEAVQENIENLSTDEFALLWRRIRRDRMQWIDEL